MMLVEFLDSILQIVALLPFNQKLHYLFATLDVLGFDLSYLLFLRALPLGFGLNRPERVLGKFALLLATFCLVLPRRQVIVGNLLA
jgi:hypothetical protein